MAKEIPAVPGVPTSRRSLAYTAILTLAQDLIGARFALARALDKMSTTDVLDLLDEVAETLEEHAYDIRPRKTTLRDEIPRQNLD